MLSFRYIFTTFFVSNPFCTLILQIIVKVSRIYSLIPQTLEITLHFLKQRFNTYFKNFFLILRPDGKSDSAIVNVENLEISKKNIAVVVPSPRKINMEKMEPCERKYRSRSPMKERDVSPTNIKTPPRRILHNRKGILNAPLT